VVSSVRPRREDSERVKVVIPPSEIGALVAAGAGEGQDVSYRRRLADLWKYGILRQEIPTDEEAPPASKLFYRNQFDAARSS